MNHGERYVAVGSSFGAGPGLTPRVPGSPRLSGRSQVNYAHLVASAAGLDLVDVTYSGATTAGLLHADARGHPAQLDAVTADTRLVTVTAGGNDIGYLGTLTMSSLPWPLRRLPSVRRTVAAFEDGDALDRGLAALHEALGAVLQRIHDRAPEARAALVDYLTILPPDASVDTAPMPPAVADWGRGVAARLSATMAAAAAEHGALYVPVAAASVAHHAWSDEPWTNRFHLTFRGGAAYHPTAAGMRAVAAQVLDVLGN